MSQFYSIGHENNIVQPKSLDRQTDRDRERQRQRGTETETDRQRQRQTDRYREKLTCFQKQDMRYLAMALPSGCPSLSLLITIW